MFAKLLKIKFSETVTKPPVIVTYVLSIILNIVSFILVWNFSNKSFFYNSFIYILISFAVDFVLIFLLCFYLFLDDMLNYNDVNYVSKSISKGIIAWTKIFLILCIITIKAILDSIFVLIFMVSVHAETWEMASDILVTLFGQIVFCITLVPFFLLISLSKKTLSFIGGAFGLLLGVFGLGLVDRTALVDVKANNTLTYDVRDNKVNYASIYNDTTEETKIATEENDPKNYTKNLNTDWRSAISNVNKAADFMPSNLFFSFSELLYNSTSKYYKDLGYAIDFTSKNYGFNANRFVFNDYQKIRINNKDQLFFFNPEDVNVFKMNSIELGDFIIDSFGKIKGINFKDDGPRSSLSRILTNITNAGSAIGGKWSLEPEELRIVADLLGMTNVNPSMFYVFMYGDQLLKRTPSILYKIQSHYSTAAAELFSALFLNSQAANAIVEIPSSSDTIGFQTLKYSTIFNINGGISKDGFQAIFKEMTPFSNFVLNRIPFPYIKDVNAPPLPTTIDFMKNKMMIFNDAGAKILLNKRTEDSMYENFTNFAGITIGKGSNNKVFKEDVVTKKEWVKAIDAYSSSNGELEDLFRAIIKAAGNQSPAITNVYGNDPSATIMFINKYDVNTFSYTNMFTSIPYTNSAMVFTILNIVLLPLLLYVSIFCYKRTSLDSKNN